MSQQSLLKIPSALSLLGFRVCPVDTPCLTSGHPKPTPKEAPVSILGVTFIACHTILRDSSTPSPTTWTLRLGAVEIFCGNRTSAQAHGEALDIEEPPAFTQEETIKKAPPVVPRPLAPSFRRTIDASKSIPPSWSPPTSRPNDRGNRS